MVLVHMRDRALLRLQEIAGIRDVADELRRREPGGAREAAIEVASFHGDAIEARNPRSRHRGRTLDGAPGSAAARADRRSLAARPITVSRGWASGSPFPPCTRRSERRGSDRMLRVCADRPDRRRIGEPSGRGRHVDERREWVARSRLERREGADADGAQQALRIGDRIEIVGLSLDNGAAGLAHRVVFGHDTKHSRGERDGATVRPICAEVTFPPAWV